MSLAGDVINRARDVHPAFTRAQTPDASALRMLTGVRKRLYNVATRAHRAAFIVTSTYALTEAAVESTGLVVDASLYTENVRMLVNTYGNPDEAVRLPIMESAAGISWPYTSRYGVFEGQDFTLLRLYPNDFDGWNDTTSILVDRIPALPELTALASEIGIENSVDEALSMALATQMALRTASDGKSGPQWTSINGMAEREQEQWLTHLAEQRRGATFQVREGMR